MAKWSFKKEAWACRALKEFPKKFFWKKAYYKFYKFRPFHSENLPLAKYELLYKRVGQEVNGNTVVYLRYSSEEEIKKHMSDTIRSTEITNVEF